MMTRLILETHPVFVLENRASIPFILKEVMIVVALVSHLLVEWNL
jgi:hypothetical protein